MRLGRAAQWPTEEVRRQTGEMRSPLSSRRMNTSYCACQTPAQHCIVLLAVAKFVLSKKIHVNFSGLFDISGKYSFETIVLVGRDEAEEWRPVETVRTANCAAPSSASCSYRKHNLL